MIGSPRVYFSNSSNLIGNKKFVIVLTIIITILVLFGSVIYFNMVKSPSTNNTSNSTNSNTPIPAAIAANDNYSAPLPDSKLQPQFFLQGTVVNIESNIGRITVKDAKNKQYIIVVDPKTVISYESLPGTANNLEKLGLEKIKIGSQVSITSQSNFAGSNILKAAQILIPQPSLIPVQEKK